MVRKRLIAVGVAASLVAGAPVTPALAWHHHGGPWFLPFAIGAAVVGTAAAIATAPLAAVAPPAPYPGYGHAPPPYGYGPPPGYYYAPYGSPR